MSRNAKRGGPSGRGLPSAGDRSGVSRKLCERRDALDGQERTHPQSKVKRIGVIGTAAIVLICIAAAFEIRS